MKKLRTRNIKKAIETWEVDESCPEVKLSVTTETTNKVVVKEAKLTGKGPHGTTPTFVHPKFFKAIQKLNPWSDFRGKWGWDGMVIDAKDIYFGKVQVSKKNLVYPYGSGHVLFNGDHKPLTRAYHFDYIGTPFSNKWCDLKAMLEHLKNHPWVLNPEKLVIEKIPYYNNDSGREAFITMEDGSLLTITPPQDVYEEMYEEAIKGKNAKDRFSIDLREMVHSGAPHYWGKENLFKVILPKDYMDIRQFHKPSKVEAD